MNRNQRRQAARRARKTSESPGGVVAAVESGSVQTALDTAVRYHEAGDLKNATEIYQQVLEQQPNNANALHLLGVAASQVGQSELALTYLERSAAVGPDSPATRNNLGKVLQDCSRPAEAVKHFQHALRHNARFPEAHVNLGNAYCQLDMPDQAVIAYRKAIDLNPGLAEAYKGLGDVLKNQGQLCDASTAYRRAVDAAPEYVGAHIGLGAVLLATGDPAGAADAYRHAVAQRPDLAEAQAGLGTALTELERFNEAVDAFRLALRSRPDLVVAHNGMGSALLRQGKLNEAVVSLRNAIALKPDSADAYFNLGNALQRKGELDEAVAAHRKAVALAPGSADTLNNLANALKEQGNLEEAIAEYRATVVIRPDFAEAHSNLGVALARQGQFADAVACYNTAIDLKPDYADAHTNLGNAFFEQGKFDEAIACHDQSLALSPGYADAHSNRAFPLLAQGNIEAGWREYEHRLRKADARTLFVAKPSWNGGPLEGKTILVHTEQGIGDEILFASCLPDLIAHAGHCVIECEPRLRELFTRSFPAATVGGRPRADLGWLKEAPPIDIYVMLASLMRHFRPGLDSFPDHRGYLVADKTARDRFGERLAALGPGLKVGVSWRSMRRSRWHASYSALEDWRSVLELPAVQFVNLQYDDPGDEIADINKRFGVQVHDFADLDLRDDLDDVAALISALDLVIAPGNTVTALAGALGMPLWILTPEPNWCMFGTDAYPWFPSAKVYLKRIGAVGWSAVLDDVTRDLRKLTHRPA